MKPLWFPELKVTCSKCGFLTFRDAETRQLVEIEEWFRGNPAFAALSDWHPYHYVNYPICFRRVYPLAEEVRRHIGLGTLNSNVPEDASIAFNRVIKDGRWCREFTRWQQGFTPKEHLEMLDRKWRLRHEEEVRQAVLKSEDRRDARVDAREERRDKEASQRHRNELLVFGLVLGGLTILAAFIERGSDLWPF